VAVEALILRLVPDKHPAACEDAAHLFCVNLGIHIEAAVNGVTGHQLLVVDHAISLL